MKMVEKRRDRESDRDENKKDSSQERVTQNEDD